MPHRAGSAVVDIRRYAQAIRAGVKVVTAWRLSRTAGLSRNRLLNRLSRHQGSVVLDQTLVDHGLDGPVKSLQAGVDVGLGVHP